KAIEAFAKSLALVPEQLTVLGELARAEEAAGELAAALETWKRYQAIQIDGRWPGALPDLGHFDMGLVYAKMKNAEEALGCFQRSARLDPSNPNVHKMMGDFYAAKGDYASSLAAYDQALKIAPGFAEAAQARALAEAQMRKAPN
ncbi:tetratricopeptide repeat protein, partial [Candidatus Sumerlaeota bacterium]|nr:tetratricopeptide repeat protein [Candidatus Sumerlaeota bacterium]